MVDGLRQTLLALAGAGVYRSSKASMVVRWPRPWPCHRISHLFGTSTKVVRKRGEGFAGKLIARSLMQTNRARDFRKPHSFLNMVEHMWWDRNVVQFS